MKLRRRPGDWLALELSRSDWNGGGDNTISDGTSAVDASSDDDDDSSSKPVSGVAGQPDAGTGGTDILASFGGPEGPELDGSGATAAAVVRADRGVNGFPSGVSPAGTVAYSRDGAHETSPARSADGDGGGINGRDEDASQFGDQLRLGAWAAHDLSGSDRPDGGGATPVFGAMSGVGGLSSDDPGMEIHELPTPYGGFADDAGVWTGGDAVATPAGGLDEPQQNGDSRTTVNVANSGNQGINGLLSGVRWSGSITYSDPDNANDYQAGYFSDGDGDGISAQNEGFSQFSAQQMRALHFALNDAIYNQPAGAAGFSVEGFTNLSITYGTSGSGTSTLRYANSSDAGTAYAYYPNNNIYGGDSFFGVNARTPTAGNYSWMTTLHELGHSLGLAHGHTGGAFGAMPANIDSHEFSLMTYRSYIGSNAQFVYNEAWSYPQTYMMYDIAALQYMYGADFTTNNGNTVYSWSPTTGQSFINGTLAIDPGANRIFSTIWDGDGVDTYDLSNYSTNLNVDLTPGGFSTFSLAQRANLGGGPNGGFARGNVFNALQFNNDARSLIENAIGGSGADTIKGNAAANTLTGNGGNDTLDGGTGNDTLVGGAGADSLIGGSGADTFVYNAASELVAGESLNTDSSDRIQVNGAGLFDFRGAITSGFVGEVEFGAGGVNNTVRINGDRIAAAAVIDFFSGGTSNILEVYDPAGNTFTTLSGFVIQDAEAGDALRLHGNNLNESLFGAATFGTEIYGEAGNDTLTGGSGSDNLWGGIGSDSLVGGSGFDYARYDYATGAVGVRLDFPSFNSGEAAGDTFNGVEGLVGSSFNDVLVGNGSGNTILGLSGSDAIYGQDDGDALLGGDGDDNLWGGLGTDYIDGGVGFDYVRFDFAGAGVVARLDISGSNTGEAAGDFYLNVEGLVGSVYDDALVGDGAGNTLISIAGSDQLYGLGGNDALLGGDGDDNLWGDTGTDFVDGESGFDYARYDFAGSGVVITLETGSGSGGEADGDFLLNIEGIIGSNYADYIVGNGALNALVGLGGDDILFGNQGTDFMAGGSGNDTFAFRAADFESGVYDWVQDMGEGAGNFDAVTLIGVPFGSVQLFDTPNGALVTTAALAGNGGVIVQNFTVAQLVDQLYVV